MQFFRSVIDSPLTHDFLMGAWIAPILPREEEEEEEEKVVLIQESELKAISADDGSSCEEKKSLHSTVKKVLLTKHKFLVAQGLFLLKENFNLIYILTMLAATQKNNQAKSALNNWKLYTLPIIFTGSAILVLPTHYIIPLIQAASLTSCVALIFFKKKLLGISATCFALIQLANYYRLAPKKLSNSFSLIHPVASNAYVLVYENLILKILVINSLFFNLFFSFNKKPILPPTISQTECTLRFDEMDNEPKNYQLDPYHYLTHQTTDDKTLQGQLFQLLREIRYNLVINELGEDAFLLRLYPSPVGIVIPENSQHSLLNPFIAKPLFQDILNRIAKEPIEEEKGLFFEKYTLEYVTNTVSKKINQDPALNKLVINWFTCEIENSGIEKESKKTALKSIIKENVELLEKNQAPQTLSIIKEEYVYFLLVKMGILQIDNQIESV